MKVQNKKKKGGQKLHEYPKSFINILKIQVQDKGGLSLINNFDWAPQFPREASTGADSVRSSGTAGEHSEGLLPPSPSVSPSNAVLPFQNPWRRRGRRPRTARSSSCRRSRCTLPGKSWYSSGTGTVWGRQERINCERGAKKCTGTATCTNVTVCYHFPLSFSKSCVFIFLFLMSPDSSAFPNRPHSGCLMRTCGWGAARHNGGARL